MQSTNLDFDAVTQGLQTKSDKIRALAREGVATADIARYLGIRYQHARNVLVGSGLHQRRDDATSASPLNDTASADGVVAWLSVDSLGRLPIPANLLEAAGIGGGEPVYLEASTERIEILSRRAALQRAQQIARRFVPEGVSLVDELIAERRRAASVEG